MSKDGAVVVGGADAVFLGDLLGLLGGDVAADDVLRVGEGGLDDGGDEGLGHLSGADEADAVHFFKFPWDDVNLGKD